MSEHRDEVTECGAINKDWSERGGTVSERVGSRRILHLPQAPPPPSPKNKCEPNEFDRNAKIKSVLEKLKRYVFTRKRHFQTNCFCNVGTIIKSS